MGTIPPPLTADMSCVAVNANYGQSAPGPHGAANIVSSAKPRRPAASPPRFVVTSLTPAEAKPQQLYDKTYRLRGEIENRRKPSACDGC
jgi:hypothetical protein